MVVFIGLVAFSDVLLIVEGSWNVKGSAHTLRAELKLKGSCVSSLQERHERSWGPTEAIKLLSHGLHFPLL